MSQGTPRKFSEKIAILERKQNEEQELFHNVMRDVRAITSNKTSSSTAASPTMTYPCSPMSASSGMSPSDAQCSTTKHHINQSSQQQPCGSPSTLSASVHSLAFAWNRSGGSLPNVHQIDDYQMCNEYSNWNGRGLTQGHQIRTRSPGAHYHPYRHVGYPTSSQKTGERVPPLDNHMITSTIHLQLPDSSWSRARSDPTIHMNTLAASSVSSMNTNYGYMTSLLQQQQQQSQAQTCASSSTTPTNTNQFQIGYRNVSVGNAAATNYPVTTNFVQYPSQPQPQQLPVYNSNMQQQQQQQQQPQQQFTSQVQQHYYQQQQQQSNNINNMKQQQQILNRPSSSGGAVDSMPNMSAAMMQQCSLYNGGGQMSGVTVPIESRGPMSVPAMTVAGSSYTKSMNLMNSGSTSFQLQQMMQQQQQQQFTFPAGQPQFHHQRLSAIDEITASQSAPTSPAQDSMEAPARQQWPPTRHFSASPDTLDIPNIVLTGADGTLDCFQDLQNLHLDNEIQQLLNDPNSNEQLDPVLETQLLN